MLSYFYTIGGILIGGDRAPWAPPLDTPMAMALRLWAMAQFKKCVKKVKIA